jgi:hypothetical protein
LGRYINADEVVGIPGELLTVNRFAFLLKRNLQRIGGFRVHITWD